MQPLQHICCYVAVLHYSESHCVSHAACLLPSCTAVHQVPSAVVKLCKYQTVYTCMKGVDPLDLMPSTSAGFSVSSELLLRARRRAERSSRTSVSAMLSRPVPWTPAWLTSLYSALHDALRPDHCPESDRVCAIARQQVPESLSVSRCVSPAHTLRRTSVGERSKDFSTSATCRWLPRCGDTSAVLYRIP